jgi:6-phosphogluconolactonase (cycloisomerase 2 family)
LCRFCKYLSLPEQRDNFIVLPREGEGERRAHGYQPVPVTPPNLFTQGERMKITLTSVTIALALSVTSAGLAQESHSDQQGAVFIMTNAADKNEIIVYSRAANGTLKQASSVDTGGRGSGGVTDPLESQGSVILSQDHKLLFAVNAGSGSISAFRVHGSDLVLTDVVHSGGAEPNALAQYGDVLYVLNTGGSSSVSGFTVNGDGKLTPIAHSVRFLSTNTSGAASLAFSPDGRLLAVTERLTNDIDVFSVHQDGTLSSITTNQDASAGTFTVTFAPNGTALVVETGPAGAQNGSTISSFGILDDGHVFSVDPGVPTLGAAACWEVVTPDGHFVYTGNSGSSSISGFAITGNGTLTPVNQTVVATQPTGTTNIDMAISSDGKFLYGLNVGAGTIGIWAINKDGSLTFIGTVGGVLAGQGFNGIAAL